MFILMLSMWGCAVKYIVTVDSEPEAKLDVYIDEQYKGEHVPNHKVKFDSDTKIGEASLLEVKDETGFYGKLYLEYTPATDKNKNANSLNVKSYKRTESGLMFLTLGMYSPVYYDVTFDYMKKAVPKKTIPKKYIATYNKHIVNI